MTLNEFKEWFEKSGLEEYTGPIRFGDAVLRKGPHPQCYHGNKNFWYVNQAFRSLPENELKFAVLHSILQPIPRSSCLFELFEYLFWLFFVDFLSGYFFLPKALPNGFPIVGIFGIVYLTLKVWKSRNFLISSAHHIERVALITGDPLSVKSYLARLDSDVRSQSRLPWKKIVFFTPTKSVLRYGKDERLKAFLKSDLSHPISERS
jgi:hypothetical protein